MKSFVLFILLLLPSLCFAGQGMGPGPGLGLGGSSVEVNSFEASLSPWAGTGTWGIQAGGANGTGNAAKASLLNGEVSYTLTRNVTITRSGATAKFYYTSNFEGTLGNEGSCSISANGPGVGFDDLGGFWSSQQTIALPVGSYPITVTMTGKIGKSTYCGIDEFEIYY